MPSRLGQLVLLLAALATLAPLSGCTTADAAASPVGSGAALPEWHSRLPTFDPSPPPVTVDVPEGAGVPWISRIQTDQRVAFITIDDGWIKRKEFVDLVRAAKVPVTLFLSGNAIRDNPAYFTQFTAIPKVYVESHTLTHTKLKGLPYEQQEREICGSADQLATLYGRRPVLFRPPFGEKDDNTLLAARNCGMKAAFFWKETVDKGVVRYQSGSTVRQGDIILMHFRDRFVDDFIAALQAIKNAGLTPALLEDYVA